VNHAGHQTTVSGFTPGRCDRCGRMVWWAKTRREKWQMIEPISSYTEGDIVMVGFGEAARAVVLTEAEQNDGLRRVRFFAHAAKCIPTQLHRRGVLIFPPRPLPNQSGVTR